MPAERRKASSKRPESDKEKKKEKGSQRSGSDEQKNDTKDDPSAKYRSTGKRIVVRLTTIILLLVGAHLYFGQKENFRPFAKQSESVSSKFAHVTCSNDYQEDRKRFKECAPIRCGRGVMDHIVSQDEARRLLKVAKSGLALGGSNGGASILDLHSGALSKGDSFINIYKLLEQSDAENIFTQEDISLYRKVADKIKLAIASRFQIPQQKLYLTHPTFFSRMTTRAAKTVHDEYWHPHVDKETYETFDYTSLLYLSDYGTDFHGGRFVFIDKKGNYTIEPKMGRLSFFTSGSENTHYVEKVSRGTRYAITVSFTCDKKHAIKYPSMGS
ncbi:2-oxoglutarate and iron-dependent oxygenase domain-containing protein 3-like [Diadema antillarum]|uniref:2-oxoglutarate and iron-dependent oxygenase domain-containing protein 3-like n=1 Tax=Diadema antillarum TaxID=105358 RepID=UPI003A89D083